MRYSCCTCSITRRRLLVPIMANAAFSHMPVPRVQHSCFAALVAGFSHKWPLGGGSLPELRRGAAALLQRSVCHAGARNCGLDVDLRQWLYTRGKLSLLPPQRHICRRGRCGRPTAGALVAAAGALLFRGKRSRPFRQPDTWVESVADALVAGGRTELSRLWLQSVAYAGF